MSLKENDAWVEAAYENFDQAVEEGNYALCKDIIEDMKDKGFGEYARTLEIVLKALPLTRFTKPSPYEY